MKKTKIRKIFAIIDALLTGGLAIGLISLVSHTAEAGIWDN
jgi:hypothetical protein